MQNKQNPNNKKPYTKRFFTIRDVNKALEKKGIIERENLKCIRCGSRISNTCILGYGYFAVICVNCDKTMRLFRKTPDKMQKIRFLDYIDKHKELWIVNNTLRI